MYRDMLADFVEPEETAVPVLCPFLPPRINQNTQIPTSVVSKGRLIILGPATAKHLSSFLLAEDAQPTLLSLIKDELQDRRCTILCPLGIFMKEIEMLRMIYVTNTNHVIEVTTLGKRAQIYYRIAATTLQRYCNGNEGGTGWTLIFKNGKGSDNIFTSPLARTRLNEALKQNPGNYHPFYDVTYQSPCFSSISNLAAQMFATFTSNRIKSELQRLKSYISHYAGAFFQVMLSDQDFDVFLHIVPEAILTERIETFTNQSLNLKPTCPSGHESVLMGVLAFKSKNKDCVGMRLLMRDINGSHYTCNPQTGEWINPRIMGGDISSTNVQHLLDREANDCCCFDRLYDKSTSFFLRESLITAMHLAVLQTMAPRFRDGGIVEISPHNQTHFFNPYLFTPDVSHGVCYVAQKPRCFAIRTITCDPLLNTYHEYTDDMTQMATHPHELISIIKEKNLKALSTQYDRMEITENKCDEDIYPVMLQPLSPTLWGFTSCCDVEESELCNTSIAEEPTCGAEKEFSEDSNTNETCAFQDDDDAVLEHPKNLRFFEERAKRPEQEPDLDEAQETECNNPQQNSEVTVKIPSGTESEEIIENEENALPAPPNYCEALHYLAQSHLREVNDIEIQKTIEETIESTILMSPFDEVNVEVQTSSEEPPPLPPKKKQAKKRTTKPKQLSCPKKLKKSPTAAKPSKTSKKLTFRDNFTFGDESAESESAVL
ncbi:fibrinogen C-terminal domain-like motif protein [Ranid herpesvirus 3]|uniref:Fibrinogen C-terminal domain-like motif protein n=1 Tax=Ranid herpesvirus 3 TaxID=1987509 RepID=A0A1X9T587_9VIRU|nr:fibrinogen C-terminal domain-like motif protein [Ranid herpesvirus 3]ARR28815.1 fibrinogen C-terminal domain-like motif protein [Ranid herpesvirus 3]